jgi:hypothetical protein
MLAQSRARAVASLAPSQSAEAVQRELADERRAQEGEAPSGVALVDLPEHGEGAFAAVYDGLSRHGSC